MWYRYVALFVDLVALGVDLVADHPDELGGRQRGTMPPVSSVILSASDGIRAHAYLFIIPFGGLFQRPGLDLGAGRCGPRTPAVQFFPDEVSDPLVL